MSESFGHQWEKWISWVSMAALVAVLTIVGGCKDKKDSETVRQGAISLYPSEPGVYVGSQSKSIAEMQPDDVIVSVNGRTLTRSEYDLMLASVAQLHRANNPGSNPQQLASRAAYRAKRMVREFITKEMLLQEAERQGVEATPAHWQEAGRALEKIAAEKNVEIDQLADAAESELRLAYQVARENARILALRQQHFGASLQVTPEDIAGAKKRIAEYNRICAVTNQLVLSRAKVIVERIRGGEDFFAVALDATEDEEYPDGQWGELTRFDFDEPEVEKEAFVLEVGKVSDPIMTDDGVVIIKVLERKGIDTPVALEEPTVTLGRILLMIGHPIEGKTDEILHHEIGQERLRQLQTPWFQEMRKKTRLEYPNGTNFFPKVKSAKKANQRRLVNEEK